MSTTAHLVLVLSSAFGLDVGQSLGFQSRMDCEIKGEQWDLNGAASASRGSGKKRITFLFPDNVSAKSQAVTIVEVTTTQAGSTFLSNAVSSGIPKLSDIPQPPIIITVGEAFFAQLASRYGQKNRVWDYEDSQIGVHGDVVKAKGVCTLISEAYLG